MKKAENDTLKKLLRHYIDLEYYANGVDEDMQILLEELGSECDRLIDSQNSYSTKDTYSFVYRAIKEKVESFEKKLEERMEKEAENIKNKESEFLSVIYGTAITIGTIALAKILFAPMDGRDTLKSFVERTKKNILRTYDTALRSGYLFGKSSSDVKNQTKTSMTQISRGMGSAIKTAIPSFAKTTDKIIFLENNLEVVWCATLDGRTCLTCGALHGKHFTSVSAAPANPLHNLCRCILLPSKLAPKNMPTYEEYIDSLSDDEQLHILGRSRYEWHKQGVHLEQFVNNGKKLTVEEIDKKLKEAVME